MIKRSFSTKIRKMIGIGSLGVLFGLFITLSPALGETTEMETCQCGVFLLGMQPLVFSADAKPILSGMPVPANCSAQDGKLECATICRQLIETMSQSNEKAPLVQTVVLAATRTLACQRFNESERVPLPRNLDATGSHQARLDDQTNKWKFIAGPLPRSELGSETESHNAEQNNGAEEDSDGNSLVKLTLPKYLGGFYRWCDEHWIYAGISLHEPLCCLQHLPKKCPTRSKSARNGRRPRLIIRRCKNDDCSSEEDFQNLELSAETPSTKTPPTTPSITTDSEETELPDTFDNATSSETETLNPFDTTSKPAKNRKPLNSTVVAEAFKFVNSLMDSLGYGDVVQGITSVLPSSTASELLERVDVGGWVTNYQDRYLQWPREFSMGYCYVEYSLYNMASDGFMATTNNLLSRVFKAQPPSSAPSRSSMPQHHSGPSLGEVINGSPPQAYGNNPNNVNNYISPMAPLPENSFNAYGQPNIGIGNRRVRRSPGVTVSRSYSSAIGSSPSDSSGPPIRRATVRRKLVQRARNAPSSVASDTSSTYQTVPNTALPVIPTPQNPAPSFHQVVVGNTSGNSFSPKSSFVPTNYQGEDQTRFFAEPQQPIPLNNPHYHRFQPEQAPLQRSHSQQAPPNLVEYARPRRNNPPLDNNGYYQNRQQQQQQQQQQYSQPQPQAQRKSNVQSAKAKEGPSGPSLMNIANMLVQTAMAGNGNGNDGDKVTSIMQNALPLVSQVATNPAIQNMVSSLVTSFLTPPHANKPPPPPPTSPSQHLDDDDDEEMYESQELKPVKQKNPPRKPDPLESNEINEPETLSSNNKPSGSSPPNGGGGDGSIISTMVSQMISTYIKHLFSPGPSVNREPLSNKDKPSSSRPSRPGDDSSKPQGEGESKDIVDMISGVAKPFFISYFGVVPGEPGFGKLRISDRRDRLRFVNQKDGSGPYKTEILQNDPDPGTGITDVLLGSVNLPETGNGIYDFGNRVVYAFSRANDPQQGMYCFKQYTVNKMWDYFRVGVRAVFKK